MPHNVAKAVAQILYRHHVEFDFPPLIGVN